MPVQPVEIFTGGKVTSPHTVHVARANYWTNNADKRILNSSSLLSDMTFQARAAESTNLSYLGIQEEEQKERCRETDGQPGATDLYTGSGAPLIYDVWLGIQDYKMDRGQSAVLISQVTF